jgi:hypothetical protein
MTASLAGGTGDDGAIHAFWSFIRSRRENPDDLVSVDALRDAIAAFDAAGGGDEP